MNTQKTNTNLKRMAICLLASSFALTSCTSLQQSTSVASDDLYYTPNNKSVEQAVVQTEEDNYQDYQNYQDDRYLRLKVANRNRWSGIDDFGYWNDPRFNNSFYPSYMGWNSWYTGYYGASWYSPFGPSYSMGWGGYSPFMSSYGFGMGWGYDDFAFGYGGYGGFGFGYGGLGYSRYGWNPYSLGYWNPYGSYFYGGGYGGYNNGGYMSHGGQFQQRIPVQPNKTNLAAYNNVRNFNGAGASRPVNGLNASRNLNSNSGSSNSNNFGSLIRRSLNSNTSNNTNRFSATERQSRFSNSNSNNNTNSNFNTNNNRQFNSTPSNNVGNSGGSSGGSAPRATGNFVGGGRKGGGR